MGLPKRSPAKRQHRGPALKRYDGLTPADSAIVNLVRQIKSTEPKWDAEGLFSDRARELAEEIAVPYHEIYEEFASRTAARFYDAGFNVDEAEMLAWTDTLERFAARRK